MTTDLAKYHAASLQFRDRYFAMPGDLTNATAFWGSVTASGASCASDNAVGSGAGTGVGTGTQTCNGNGDGALEQLPLLEIYRFPKHLANAGLIEGSYKGTGMTWNLEPNVFPTSGGNTYIWPVTVGSYTDSSSTLINNTPLYKHVTGPVVTLNFGSFSYDFTGTPVVTGSDAWNIDTKLDDGLAHSGKILSRTGRITVGPTTYPTGCTTPETAGFAATVGSTAMYNLTSTTKTCVVHYTLN